jgi:tetratricopeptide (TPR) repeat protein
MRCPVTLLRICFYTLMLGVMSPSLHALDAQNVSEQINEAYAALQEWQLPKAKKIAARLNEKLPDIPPVQALVGTIKFHEGQYEESVRLLQRASEGGMAPPLLALAQSTYDETKGYVQKRSAHFVMRVPPGKDELLFEKGLWALERAYQKITEAYDFEPGHMIPVDVFHDPRGLAQVSSLTEKEITTSGTIALCKYNRLMITSPKALARGYSWLDTLAHEFIHLIISEKSKNTVPIWLHEGLAKYSESLWYGEPGLALEPASENLLADATQDNDLVTFEEMHPSMAKLPSQEKTALAFAEVFTVIEFMHQREVRGTTGFGITNQLLSVLSSGASMDASLSQAVGFDLRQMQTAWRKYLKKRPFRRIPGAQPRQLIFVKGDVNAAMVEEEEDERAVEDTDNVKNRKWVRLGNLLRRRGHKKAATLEYEKAIHAGHHPKNASLLNRLAGLYMDLERFDKASALVSKTIAIFPNDPQTRILEGRLALRQKRYSEARHAYDRAAWENPFHPEIYMAAYEIAELEKNEDAVSQAKEHIALLTGKKKSKAKSVLTRPKHYGTINIDSQPWGMVYINGRETGLTTPLMDYPLELGAHIVRVTESIHGTTAEENVDIVEGKLVRVNLQLKKAGKP